MKHPDTSQTKVSTCDLTDILQRLSKEYENFRSHDNVLLQCDAPAESIEISGADSAVHQILEFITSACLDNSQPNEAVRISVRTSPAVIDVTYRFTPNSMFILLMRRLLEPLKQQINLAGLKNTPNSYIALLLARWIATRQRIKIWMEIEKSTMGSIHCYFLPAYLNTVPSREKPLVLVIEDNPHIGKLLELYLSRAGYQTRYAPDSSKAMDIALDIKPDLITLDVYMPNKDGWQILSAFRKNEETVKIPVIVITVMKDAQIGYELGASDYLTKPVEKDNLIHSAYRLAPVFATSASREPLERILVISEQNELLEAVQSRLGDATLKVLAPDVQTMYEGVGDFDPQLTCFAFTELKSSMKYLLYRLRLVPHITDIPAVLITKEPLDETLRQSLTSIMDEIFSIDAFDSTRLASY